MIIIDTLLRKRAAENNPIRVGMIGAGFMARGVANQIINYTPGMRLSAIANRTLANAKRAYTEAGVIENVVIADTLSTFETALRNGGFAITEDPEVLIQSEQIDCLIDVTGALEFGARMTLSAINHGKPMVSMNAELDGTVGPILKRYADKAGVIFCGSDGDQPGVQMNLFRFVKQIGITPLVCGNIKGLQDPYRTPTTQAAFAERWGQDPYMVTSFADGTKISFEQAIVANATGMSIGQRGMFGYDHREHLDKLVHRYDLDLLKARGGIVDYVVGAQPNPGVYVLGTHDDPKQKHFLNLYKLGEGPLYSFYTPYHLCHFEVPISVARVILLKDPVIQPIDGPRVDVVATAKTDLKAGDIVDGLGGYLTYGQCETYAVSRAENLLPMGLSEGCRLLRDLRKDDILTYDDVERPADRLIDSLRKEQDILFPVH